MRLFTSGGRVATSNSFTVQASAATLAPRVPAHDGRVRRRYRKPLGPRTWRTRVDPFAAVWDEMVVILTARPERTAKELLAEGQARYPGQYADKSLRTLQRRVRAWRASAILTLDVEWMANDPLAGVVVALPTPGLAAAQQSG